MAKQEEKQKKLNLHQKLLEVRKSVEYLQKTETGFKFKFVGGSSVLGALRPKLDEYGILLNYDIEEVITEEKTKRTKLKYVFKFINAEDPKDIYVNVIWTQGIGDTIQDMGGYNTYTVRYFLMNFFNIPSDEDDPDSFKKKTDKQNENSFINNSQVIQILELINGHDDIRHDMLNRYKNIKFIPNKDFEVVCKAIIKKIDDKKKEKKNAQTTV